MTLSAYGKTDVGLLRSNNEDSFFLDERSGLFIVADGMGGHAAGEVASKMAIETVCRQLEPQLDNQTSTELILSLLAETVEAASRLIAQAGDQSSAWSGMGTTVTILLVHADQAGRSQ